MGMRILLLTDCPPHRSLTAGLVLDQLCRWLPDSSLACFHVYGLPETNVPPEMAIRPYASIRGPNQFAPKLPDRWWTRPINATSSFCTELYASCASVPQCLREATAFARDFRPSLIWATLQGQTMIRLSRALAERIGVPLSVQVYDPPEWWLRANRIDRFWSRRILDYFDKTLTGCR